MSHSTSPALRMRAPADYPGCPVTVDIALAEGRALKPPKWGIPDAIIPLLGFVIISVVVAVVAEAVASRRGRGKNPRSTLTVRLDILDPEL